MNVKKFQLQVISLQAPIGDRIPDGDIDILEVETEVEEEDSEATAGTDSEATDSQ